MQTGSLKLGDFGCHGCREQVGVSLFRDDFKDLVKNRPKIQIKQSIGFVHDLMCARGVKSYALSGKHREYLPGISSYVGKSL
jgi:hypothetical protein